MTCSRKTLLHARRCDKVGADQVHYLELPVDGVDLRRASWGIMDNLLCHEW